MIIKPFNAATKSSLPDIEVDFAPIFGTNIDIGEDTFFVSEINYKPKPEPISIGLLPEIIEHPKKVENIDRYLARLRVAGRSIIYFSSGRKVLDLVNCDKLKIV